MSHTPSSRPARLRLKRREDRRLRAGHPWVFSNEVDTAVSPLSRFEAGQPVVVEAAGGRPLGAGYVNPRALVCARLVSPDPGQVLDRPLIRKRLRTALALRERLYGAPWYRLVYGDSDRLPGLVLDRYGDIVVGQITTAGMERVKNEIVAAVAELLAPRGFLWRNDGRARELEALPRYTETAAGQVPETVELEEAGARFAVPLAAGQKTGWFYDQRPNRLRLRDYVHGQRVLDVFSYLGAWGIGAAAAGAASVTCVESAARASEFIRRNARNNGLGERVHVIQEDAFHALKELRTQKKKFDLIVLDPPALIQRKKDLKEGLSAYRRLNEAALALLPEEGYLISSSCSCHLSAEQLGDVLRRAALHGKRPLQILETGRQSPDHPLHPAIPETAYLKTLFCRLPPP